MGSIAQQGAGRKRGEKLILKVWARGGLLVQEEEMTLPRIEEGIRAGIRWEPRYGQFAGCVIEARISEG